MQNQECCTSLRYLITETPLRDRKIRKKAQHPVGIKPTNSRVLLCWATTAAIERDTSGPLIGSLKVFQPQFEKFLGTHSTSSAGTQNKSFWDFYRLRSPSATSSRGNNFKLLCVLLSLSLSLSLSLLAAGLKNQNQLPRKESVLRRERESTHLLLSLSQLSLGLKEKKQQQQQPCSPPFVP